MGVFVTSVGKKNSRKLIANQAKYSFQFKLILVIPCFVSTHGISWPEEKSITFMENRFVAAQRISGPKIRFYCFLWNTDLCFDNEFLDLKGDRLFMIISKFVVS